MTLSFRGCDPLCRSTPNTEVPWGGEGLQTTWGKVQYFVTSLSWCEPFALLFVCCLLADKSVDSLTTLKRSWETSKNEELYFFIRFICCVLKKETTLPLILLLIVSSFRGFLIALTLDWTNQLLSIFLYYHCKQPVFALMTLEGGLIT